MGPGGAGELSHLVLGEGDLHRPSASVAVDLGESQQVACDPRVGGDKPSVGEFVTQPANLGGEHLDEELVDRRMAKTKIVEVVTLQRQCVGRLERGGCCRALSTRNEQGLLTEGLPRTQDRQRRGLPGERHHRDLDVAAIDQVERPTEVTLMKDDLVSAIAAPGRSGQEPASLVVAKRLEDAEPGHEAR